MLKKGKNKVSSYTIVLKLRGKLEKTKCYNAKGTKELKKKVKRKVNVLPLIPKKWQNI